jgi:hypothetical protein
VVRRSLLAVLSGSLLGAYALLFVGALGGAVTSWLAFRRYVHRSRMIPVTHAAYVTDDTHTHSCASNLYHMRNLLLFVLCSAGTETEKQIKQCIGKELAQALKIRAQETATSVATASMQPCLVCIDK